MALCATCQCFDLHRIFSSSSVESTTLSHTDQHYVRLDEFDGLCFRHSDNIDPIQVAASTGCGLCGLLFDAYRSKNLEAAQEAGTFPIFLAPSYGIEHESDDSSFEGVTTLESRVVSFFFSPEEGVVHLCELDLSVDKASINFLDDLPFEPLSKLHRDPNDPDSTALASRWLQSCLNDHDCSDPIKRESSALTRFLDVGDANGNPHLVEFLPKAPPHQWAALSYCWGEDDRALELRHDTVDLLRGGVDILRFDDTVRDAILVSRRLGIQYLWIDALCIYQGDPSDWVEQSAQMGYIYGNSTVTIASVDTSAASQSFLRPRDTHYVAVPWRLLDTQSLNEPCQTPEQIYLSQRWPPGHDLLSGPWSIRAWTLQEGLLPKRILYYSSHQLAWKCGRDVRYERGVRNEPILQIYREIIGYPGGKDFWPLDLFTKFKLLSWYIKSSGCRTIHERYRVWNDLIENYTSRRMKKSADRLVAISGLAKMYGDILGDQRYIAGHWETDMLPSLLWHVRGTKLFDAFDVNIGQSEILGEISPSWSWVRGPSGSAIRNQWAGEADFKALATVDNVNFDPLEPTNLFGGVSNARLTITGPLFRVTKLYHPSWRSEPTSLSAFERHISHVIENDYGEKAADFSTEGSYAVLLLVQKFPTIEHRIDALIIQAVPSHEDKSLTTFERLGVLKLYFSNRLTPSPSMLALAETLERSFDHRLNTEAGPTEAGPTEAAPIQSKEVFQELRKSPWPLETVTLV